MLTLGRPVTQCTVYRERSWACLSVTCTWQHVSFMQHARGEEGPGIGEGLKGVMGRIITV